MEEIILDIYEKISTSKSNYEKMYLFNTIIEIKHNENIEENLYKDIKCFLKNYLESTYELQFSYDSINRNKIEQKVSYLPFNQQMKIYEYLIQLSKFLQIEELPNWAIEKKIENEIKYIKTLRATWWINPFTISKIFYLESRRSLHTLLIIILIMYLVLALILLPNYLFSSNCTLFIVKYDYFFNDFYTNHFCNVIFSFFEISSEFKIIPRNIFGAFIILLSHIIKILFVSKYIFDKFLEKININE